MEIILDLATMKSLLNGPIDMNLSPPYVTTHTFQYRMRDIALPQCQYGFVYFLISVRTLTFTFIE